MNFNETISGIIFFKQNSDCVLVGLNKKKIQSIDDYGNPKFEYKGNEDIDEFNVINNDNIIIYNQIHCCLTFMDYKMTILYKILFNYAYNTIRKFLYCDAAKQLIMMNRDARKLILFTINKNSEILSYSSFGFRNSILNFKYAFIKNSIPDFLDDEGNSKYLLCIKSKDSVQFYQIPVKDTKFIGDQDTRKLNIKDIIPSRIFEKRCESLLNLCSEHFLYSSISNVFSNIDMENKPNFELNIPRKLPLIENDAFFELSNLMLECELDFQNNILKFKDQLKINDFKYLIERSNYIEITIFLKQNNIINILNDIYEFNAYDYELIYRKIGFALLMIIDE